MKQNKNWIAIELTYMSEKRQAIYRPIQSETCKKTNLESIPREEGRNLETLPCFSFSSVT
jgi:hypothetical protein